MIINKNTITYSVAFGIIVTLALVYKYYFISHMKYFPKCLFMVLTSYQCPGCGSQRAIYHLLNLNISAAFKENMLLILSIPYLLFPFLFTIVKKRSNKIMNWRKIIYSKRSIHFILIIIFSFWIIRNIDA